MVSLGLMVQDIIGRKTVLGSAVVCMMTNEPAE